MGFYTFVSVCVCVCRKRESSKPKWAILGTAIGSQMGYRKFIALTILYAYEVLGLAG